MRTPQLQRAFRRAIGLRPWPPGGIVLLYHRVTALASDPQCLAVSPDRFVEHLAVIRKLGVPMTLETMVDLAQNDALPPGAVAVTFDDGYADNLHCAAPRLADARVPATVFVSTGTIGTGREFWWDELERMLLAPGPPGRRAEYDEMCRRLRSVSGGMRDQLLEELSQRTGQPRELRPSHRPLRSDEVSALAQADGITVGSHTESHPSLAALSAEEQRQEIAGARRRLETLTGKSVTSFAYPFGGVDDVSACTVAIAQEEGITIACANQPDSVRHGTSAHRVPRIVVRDWTGTEFQQRWTEWMATP